MCVEVYHVSEIMLVCVELYHVSEIILVCVEVYHVYVLFCSSMVFVV